MAGPRRKRVLTSDEVALWTHVTRHIEPLRPEKLAGVETIETIEATPPPIPDEKKPKKFIVADASPPSKPKAPVAPSVPPLAPLEKRLRQRLSRGHTPIDSVIDLHGMRQDEAHTALRRFVIGAHQAGYAVILVVTGKGANASAEQGSYEERGVLRRMVPHWLRMADMRSYVIGFENAAQHHGGTGALYVRIRRSKIGGRDI
jgi:DNA-nicking Smr family endonuclease